MNRRLFLAVLLAAAACRGHTSAATPWRFGTDLPDQPLTIVDPVDLVETDSLVLPTLTRFSKSLMPEAGAGSLNLAPITTPPSSPK